MGAADMDWLTSAEVRKSLRISTCDLAHLREEGRIRAEKRGNAYYYLATDVLALRGKRPETGTKSCGLNDVD
jgi:hypothetical protein